jgi:hypothetical protein
MDSTPSADSTTEDKEQEKKGYFSAAVDSISPWGTSRSITPKPKDKDVPPGEGSGLKNQHGGRSADHSTSYWRGLSSRRYPSDCPELNARWFYAVDVSFPQ